MICNFDRIAVRGRTVGELVLEPLLANDAGLTVIDVGARNGMSELPASYARNAAYVGFEPNHEEYLKLSERRTDAIKAGIAVPRFREETYYPTAIWGSAGTRDLYLTEVTGACTMMGPPDEYLAEKLYLRTLNGLRAFPRAIVGTTSVPCDTLDALIADTTTVDYLKIDVEGGEGEVLKGAERLLRRRGILFIKSEFFQLHLYRNQPLLGHQQVLLDAFGYRLLDMDMHHQRYVRRSTRIPVDADRSLFMAGDAFYAIDPDRNDLSPTDLQRLAAVSLLFGFNSFAVGLLRDGNLLPRADIDAIERALSYIPPLISVKRRWAEFPYAVARAMSRLGLRPY